MNCNMGIEFSISLLIFVFGPQNAPFSNYFSAVKWWLRSYLLSDWKQSSRLLKFGTKSTCTWLKRCGFIKMGPAQKRSFRFCWDTRNVVHRRNKRVGRVHTHDGAACHGFLWIRTRQPTTDAASQSPAMQVVSSPYNTLPVVTNVAASHPRSTSQSFHSSLAHLPPTYHRTSSAYSDVSLWRSTSTCQDSLKKKLVLHVKRSD